MTTAVRNVGETDPDELGRLLARVPVGWTRFEIAGRPWAVSRVPRGDGRTVTLEAEQLGGADAFGANVWLTSSGPVLRPCEVPAEKVLDLLRSLPEPGAGDDTVPR
jgi:peptide-methionine (S)-S-oxide reductase